MIFFIIFFWVNETVYVQGVSVGEINEIKRQNQGFFKEIFILPNRFFNVEQIIDKIRS